MEVNIFISVCNFDQSVASSPLTPISCIFNVVEMCSYIFYLLLYWIYTQQKLLQYCKDVNMIHQGIESCLFDFLWKKQTVVLDYVQPILKCRVLKLIFLLSTNGSRSFKMSATEHFNA